MLALKEVVSRLTPVDIDKAMAPHAQGPEDSRFKMVRPFAGPVAVMCAFANRLDKEHPQVTRYATPVTPEMKKLRVKPLEEKAPPGIVILLKDPTDGSILGLNLLKRTLDLKNESLSMYFRDGRFNSLVYRTDSVADYDLVTGSQTRDNSVQNPDYQVRIILEGPNLTVGFPNGERRTYTETLTYSPEMDGLKPTRDIIESAMQRFGIPPRI